MAPFVKFYIGGSGDCQSLLQILWDRMSERDRLAALWDISSDQKKDRLSEVWMQCRHVGVCFDDGGSGCFEPFAAGWIAALGERSGSIHFCFANCPGLPATAALWAGRDFLKEAGNFYDSLIALLPIPYRGARNLARGLGFKPVGILKKACSIHHHGRAVDGEIQLWRSPND